MAHDLCPRLDKRTIYDRATHANSNWLLRSASIESAYLRGARHCATALVRWNLNVTASSFSQKNTSILRCTIVDAVPPNAPKPSRGATEYRFYLPLNVVSVRKRAQEWSREKTHQGHHGAD